MALDKVANEILESAKQEGDLRIQDAEKERARILQETDLKIEKMRKADEKELQDALLRMRRQELSSAELEAKKIVLNKRKDVLNRTFDEMLDELSNLAPAEKSALYKKILADGKKIIPMPRVFCPKGEADLLAGLTGLRIPHRDRYGVRAHPGEQRRDGQSRPAFPHPPGIDLGEGAEEHLDGPVRVG